MHPVVNHLIQLQELALVRDEHKVAQGGAHLDQLTESINGMMKQLPPNIHARFDKLFKKDHHFIVPIAVDSCAVCRMKIPISLIQAVRLGRDIYSCPNCARLLYYPEGAAKRISETVSRVGPRKIGISRFSSEGLMIPKLESEDRDGVIKELACKMESEGFVDNGDKMVEFALRREAVLSTAVEHGLAFPHAREVEGGGLAVALGISKKGIKFGEGTKSLTHIVFFMAIPTAASAFYLKLLAGLSETFIKTETRKVLIGAKDAGALWKALIKLTGSTIK